MTTTATSIPPARDRRRPETRPRQGALRLADQVLVSSRTLRRPMQASRRWPGFSAHGSRFKLARNRTRDLPRSSMITQLRQSSCA